MIDEATQRLADWLGSLPEPPSLSFALPGADAASGLHCYLLEVVQAPPKRGTKGSTWDFRLRYLVLAGGPDARECQRMLDRVLIAAVEADGFEVETTPLSFELWQALALRPQPAFVLAVPARHHRDPRKVALVRVVELQQHPLEGVAGMVLGANDTPLMWARVDVPALGLSTSTDADGHFRFGAVPGGVDLKILVTAKGVVMETTLAAARDDKQGFVVRVPLPPDAL